MTRDRKLKVVAVAGSGTLFFHAAVLGTFLAASAAPTPLYRFYQETYALSPVLTTAVFAVYALALLKALLVAGSISDHLGRRPVIFGALLLELVAMALFTTASGAWGLIAARFVQGVATGIAASSPTTESGSNARSTYGWSMSSRMSRACAAPTTTSAPA